VPQASLTILSDRLVRLLKCRESKSEVPVESGEYAVEDLLLIVLGSVCESRSIPENSDKETFIAVNGRVYYDKKERVKVDGDVRITLFEVGAGG
jgi:hypothetical protein